MPFMKYHGEKRIYSKQFKLSKISTTIYKDASLEVWGASMSNVYHRHSMVSRWEVDAYYCS